MSATTTKTGSRSGAFPEDLRRAQQTARARAGCRQRPEAAPAIHGRRIAAHVPGAGAAGFLRAQRGVAMGKTNPEIGCSEFTVKNHMKSIFSNLDVTHRARAVAKLTRMTAHA